MKSINLRSCYETNHNPLMMIGFLLFVLWVTLASPLFARESAGEKEDKSYDVQRTLFEQKVSFDAQFSSASHDTVTLDFDRVEAVKVKWVISPGKQVQKGDLLIKFDDEKIDKRLKDLQHQLTTTKKQIKQEEITLESLSETLETRLKKARENQKKAQEKLTYFKKTGRKLQEEAAREQYRRAHDRLTYEQEELRQLKRMYESDDLTEETEEIILKKQKDRVRHLKFRVKEAKEERDRTLNVKIPRKARELQWQAHLLSVERKTKEVLLPLERSQTRLSLARNKRKVKDLEETITELKKDQKRLERKADITGIVYYRRVIDGRLEPVDRSVEAALKRNGTLKNGSTLLTVVPFEPLELTANIPEQKLHLVETGQDVTVQPTGFPHLALPGTVKTVHFTPGRDGTYRLRVALNKQVINQTKEAKRLQPGMTASVKGIAYRNPDVVVIPPEFLHRKTNNERTPFVYLQQDGSVEKREVQTGRVSEKWIEIQQGLKPGVTILPDSR